MGLHSDTEIYAAVVSLAVFIAKAVKDMRRDVKPTLGKLLLEECIWMGVVVRRINIARDQAKLPHLEELLEQLEIVQFVLRLARDCRYITVASFSDSVPLTASIDHHGVHPPGDAGVARDREARHEASPPPGARALGEDGEAPALLGAPTDGEPMVRSNGR